MKGNLFDLILYLRIHIQPKTPNEIVKKIECKYFRDLLTAATNRLTCVRFSVSTSVECSPLLD